MTRILLPHSWNPAQGTVGSFNPRKTSRLRDPLLRPLFLDGHEHGVDGGEHGGVRAGRNGGRTEEGSQLMQAVKNNKGSRKKRVLFLVVRPLRGGDKARPLRKNELF